MTGYALVKNGRIAEVHGSLPAVYQNISGFNNFSDAQAKTYGFIPYIYIQDEYNGYTHYLGETDFTITPDLVTGVRQILEHTPEMKERLRLDAVKNLDAVLINTLRNTDWTLLPDCELDAEELTAYAGLRSESRALRLTISDMPVEEIAALAAEYQEPSMIELHQEAYARSSAITVALDGVVQEKAVKAAALEAKLEAEAIEAQIKADAEAEAHAKKSMAETIAAGV